MNKIELSQKEIKGLQLLNNEISADITKKIIVNAVKQLIVKGPAIAARSDGIYDTEKSAEIKLSEFAVSSILLLSAKHSIDTETLQKTLQPLGIAGKTIEQLVESFDKFGDEINSRLSRLGNSHDLDELTNISVKAQYHNSSNELVYKITLESFDHEQGNSHNIQSFYCNPQELQSLIYKLKDIERHCERLTKLSF